MGFGYNTAINNLENNVFITILTLYCCTKSEINVKYL